MIGLQEANLLSRYPHHITVINDHALLLLTQYRLRLSEVKGKTCLASLISQSYFSFLAKRALKKLCFTVLIC
jgi:hypothetical protein